MATDKYINIKVNSKGAETNIKRLDNEMTNLGREVDKTNDSFGKLSKVASAIGTALATAQITKYADAYTSLQNQIRQTVNSSEQLQKRTEQLLEVSNRSRAGLSETADLYTQLVLSTESLNLSTAEQLRLTETITKSFAVSGKSAAESAGAIRQLGQALASGALRGDEFNSIAEGAPEILRALQRSLGKSAGELRAFAATGGITAEILVEALGGAADVIDGKLNNAVVTAAQNFQIAENNLTKFIGESTTVQSVMAGVGDALVTASENLETIVDLFIFGASVMAARLIPSLIQYTTATVANTAAQLTQTKAVTGVSAALGVQAVAASRSTIATNTLTLAARGFSTVMASLGGPVGLLLLASTALLTFGNDADAASDKIDRLSGVTNDFAEQIKNLTRATKANLLNNINAEIIEVNAQITALTPKLESARAAMESAGGTMGADGLRFKYNTLNQEVKDLNAQLDLLSAKTAAIVTPVSAEGFTDRGRVDGSEPESKKVDINQRLAEETLLIQQELELRRDVENGFISEAQAAEILRFNDRLNRSTLFYEAELLKLGDNELAIAELKAQYRDNELALAAEFNANLSDIEKEGSDKRVELSKKEAELKRLTRESDINNAQGIALTGLQVLSKFGDQSFKTQKKFAIAESLVNITAGVAKALNNPYPANLGFAAQVALQGAGLLQTIKSSDPSSSGSRPTISASSPSASSTRPAATQAPEKSNRVVDIRLDDDALLTGAAVKRLMTGVISSDDDIVLNITNQQQQLVRTGAISG